MEKEMLVVAKLKEGTFEKFMGFMQSPEGLAERAKVAVVEKTIGTVTEYCYIFINESHAFISRVRYAIFIN